MNAILIISLLSLFIAYLLILKVKKRAVKRAKRKDTDQSLEIRLPIKPKYSEIEWELIGLICMHRNVMLLKKIPLPLNDTISTVCQEHSLNMVILGIASHTNAGVRKAKLKKAIGITEAGEIVAKGQRNAESILSMFLKSPKHKAMIENPKWTKFGLSIEKGIRNYTTVIFTK